jgi:DNA-binding transcriptional LysR family regulator
MSRFDLNLLASLDALLEERSVTAAADKVGVSQSTMSGMLNRLRIQLQDPLLVRSGGAYDLTPRAHRLREQVRQALIKVDSLIEAKSTPDLAKIERKLVVMASQFSVLAVLPHIIRQARESCPALSFEVLPIHDPVGAVYSGSVDFCLSGVELKDVQGGPSLALRSQTLQVEPFVVVADLRHALDGPISLAQFMAYPHVATQFPGIGHSVEESLFAHVPDRKPPTIRVPDFMGVGAMVVHTDMLGLVPARLAPLMCRTWNLKLLEFSDTPHNIPLRVIWHVRHDKDPVHQMVRSLLCAFWSQVEPPDEVFAPYGS